MRLFVAKNELKIPRLGISVSKTVGNAVVRNRLKRFSREIFRQEQHNIAQGYDYLLIYSQKKSKKTMERSLAYRNATCEQIAGSFLKLTAKLTKKQQDVT